MPSNEVLRVILGSDALASVANKRNAFALAAQTSLDRRYGTGVLSLGSEPYEGINARRPLLCLVDEAHGSFVLAPASLKGLSVPCPKCRKAKRKLELSTRRSSMFGLGGYLYKIRDSFHGTVYVCTSHVTPEERFARHQSAAVRGVRGEMYDAMRERPDSFVCETQAYFFDQTSLRFAEAFELETGARRAMPLPSQKTKANSGARNEVLGRIHELTIARYVTAAPDELTEVEAIACRMLDAGLPYSVLSKRLLRATSLEKLRSMESVPYERTARRATAAPPNCIPVVFEGTNYPSVTAAARAVGKSPDTVRRMLAAEGHPLAAIPASTWERFTSLALAYFHKHGHMRFSVRQGASETLSGHDRRIRQRWVLGQLTEDQRAWLVQHAYGWAGMPEPL